MTCNKGNQPDKYKKGCERLKCINEFVYFQRIMHFHLLCLDTSTTVTSLFSLFDSFSWGRVLGATTEQRWGNERSLQITNGRLVKQMNLDDVVFKGRLNWGDGLHEQWVNVAHVEVHESHH